MQKINSFFHQKLSDDLLELRLAKIAIVALVVLWFTLPLLTTGFESESSEPRPTQETRWVKK